MSFFYDLNKKLDSIRATPEVTHKQLNERDMSRAAKGYEKYGKQGMEALAKAGREGKALDPVRKKYDKYDNKSVDEDRVGPTDAGPTLSSPDSANYKTPNIDNWQEKRKSIDKEMGDYYSVNRWPGALSGALNKDAAGQLKYVDRTAPGVINKIKNKLGYDMPDPEYGPRPDETQRLAKRYPAPTKESAGPAAAAPVKKASPGFGKDYKPLVPDTEKPGSARGTIKGGTFQADPKGRVKPPGGDPEGVKEQDKKDFNKDIDPKFKDMPKREVNRQIKQMSRDYEFNKDIDPKIRNMPKSEMDRQMRGDPEGVKEAGKKLNFADKIANAKKEVDEMLGDVAAEAMRSALSPKQKKIDMNKNGKLDANDFAMLRKGAKPEMDEERSKGTAFDMSTSRASTPKVGSTERGAKHDIKHTATGRMVTRRTDDQGNSVGADDDNEASGEKRGRGRPKGTKQSIGAKGPSGKSKLMTKEGEDDPAEKGEYDREGDMALDDIDTIESAANELQSIIDAEDNLPEWVQSKINKAMDYLDTARDYMAAQGNDQEPIAEKAVSKQQQKFMGMARAMQKGEKIKGASKELKKVASTMKPKDTEDFAKTKHKGLPDKVKSKKKEVDETSEDGRLTTTQTGPGKTSTSSSTGRISATVDKGTVSVKPAKSGGMSYGKGIYDSMNRELEQMISESMSINMSDSTEGGKSLTITATEEDALKLGMLLKNAGLGGGDMHSHDEQPCATCGMPDCGCGDVQEAVDDNAPDYPTNTEQADNNFGYAGGLNKPKTDVAGDGQTTIPNTAVHTQDEDALRRMMEMAGLAEAAKPDYIDLDKDGDKEESMKDAADDKEEDSVEESIQRMREMAGIKEAKKPDFLDMDKDGDKKEPMSKAVKDKEEKKVDESIFALTNQWKAYKG
jgi:hypothetical protein